jgi:hypothetical protein
MAFVLECHLGMPFASVFAILECHLFKPAVATAGLANANNLSTYLDVQHVHLTS